MKNKKRKPKVTKPEDFPKILRMGKDVYIKYKDGRSGKIKLIKTAMKRNRMKENWERIFPNKPYSEK